MPVAARFVLPPLAALGVLAFVLRSRLRALLTRRGRSAAHDSFTCACGQGFRVSGAGRHRIYWTEGADASDPVLAPACPSCERPLPH